MIIDDRDCFYAVFVLKPFTSIDLHDISYKKEQIQIFFFMFLWNLIWI